ncbi:metalloproteinase inhibitor 3-like [Asterias amurensis]|uniref:metalloproteinase inhibitor 3-like n=1 Tax=Asterias amurensis TaxID=7602 RepID=UPI003AB694A4
MRGPVVIVFLLMVGSLLPAVHGCICMPSHPQQDFCRADLVIVGTIESSQFISAALLSPIRLGQPDIIAYSISVESVKKGDQHQALWSSENTLRINTTATENSCGVPGLTVGQQYVLSVMVVNGEGFLNFCQFRQLYSELTTMQRRGINGAYIGGCSQCQIETCWAYGNCPLTAPDDTTCMHGNRQTHEDCYYYHGYCRARPNGKCVWKKNAEFEGCLQSTNQVS